jgi:WhiB family redox-sensing transcriptional regulator
MRDRRHWTEDASCKGRAELFFAPPGERPAARMRREAAGLRLCAACPVQPQCRDHARATLEEGLWGGETEAQRNAAGFTRRRPRGPVTAGAGRSEDRSSDLERATP